MKPAAQKGAVLQQDIASTTVPHGQAAVWWLGQSSFCIKLGQTVLYIDPYYRETDVVQEMPLRPEEMSQAGLICCTHDHADHFHPDTLPGAAAASPDAVIVIPQYCQERANALGFDVRRLHPMRGDDTFEHAGVTLRAIPSAHQQLEYDDAFGYRYLGYLIQGNGVTLYHPGDTQPYAGWDERLRRFALDLAFLPISGGDNLFYQQAVYFCAIHRPKVAVPIHYGLFSAGEEFLPPFAELLATSVPAQRMAALTVGARFVLSDK